MTPDGARTPGRVGGVSDKGKKVADQYDRGYDYTKYWDNRDYEHAAEEIAIRRLLDGQRFERAADVGGGFGRLSLLLREYADHVTLAEPSRTQLDAAATLLEGTDIAQVQMQADDLKFADGELDLLTMVRVMHHIPEPSAEFAEIARVLRPGGTAIIEVANLGHFKNRRKYKKLGQPLPTEPVSIRTAPADEPDAIAFVNHNIDTVLTQLAAAELVLTDKLSVSNLRSQTLKKYLPIGVMTTLEKFAQRPLARKDFGPSIFLKLRRR
ncbi:class I SAM-dependent methyltransferase [Aeromicrobium phragmitis]|uniref:Class I SAM-dependent methyltransferase n=1 Tax=Aeromicrobium phragmitis TaxID=2478914 RepID=A0A3L8PRQ1_9ACTN|nr:class I SAM-dependent methyltransferase [Aeromicrobium phragmitis]